MLVNEILSRGLRDRRAVASYAGLTGAPDQSGQRRREKGLARAGKARVRYGMILLAWRFLQYQKGKRAGALVLRVNADGRREVLGMEIGTSDGEPIWTEFLRKLTRRGLRGIKRRLRCPRRLKSAVTKVLSATWQRCSVGLLKKSPPADSIEKSLILWRGSGCWDGRSAISLSYS